MVTNCRTIKAGINTGLVGMVSGHKINFVLNIEVSKNHTSYYAFQPKSFLLRLKTIATSRIRDNKWFYLPIRRFKAVLYQLATGVSTIDNSVSSYKPTELRLNKEV